MASNAQVMVYTKEPSTIYKEIISSFNATKFIQENLDRYIIVIAESTFFAVACQIFDLDITQLLQPRGVKWRFAEIRSPNGISCQFLGMTIEMSSFYEFKNLM